MSVERKLFEAWSAKTSVKLSWPDIQQQLDDNPADWTLRSIYADWLEEQGNPRAESMRWMVEHNKCPRNNGWWEWHNPGTDENRVSWVLIHILSRSKNCIGHYDAWASYKTRLAAEIDLHNALVRAGKITCALIEEVEA